MAQFIAALVILSIALFDFRKLFKLVRIKSRTNLDNPGKRWH